MPTYTAGKPEASKFYVEPGNYKFRVIEATEDTSKKGNEMVKLKLRVINPDGSNGSALFDYLVFNKSSFWKVDAFLQSCGKHPGAGQPVNVEADDLIGYEGEASLTVEEYEGRRSNKVSDYIFDDFN